MKKFLLFGLAIAATLSFHAAASADVVVDNYITQQNGAEAGAVGNFRKQSFTPNVAGPGTNDTVAANAPLPAAVFLQSATFLRAVSGTNPDSGLAFIDVYAGIGDGGTYIGSSTNSIDVQNATALSSLTWNFAGLSLNSALEHAFVFSTDNIAGAPLSVRLQVARDAGGGFGDSYTAGTAGNFSNGTSPTPFDARFQVTMTTAAIPEPTSIALLGFGLVGLVARRRRS